MSRTGNAKSIWPGVRIKKAKGKQYFYWTRVPKGTPWVALPNPYTDADAFMRKMAHLQRVAIRADERNTTGTFGALVDAYKLTPKYTKKAPGTRKIYDLYLERLLVAYRDAPLSDLTPQDIQTRVMDPNGGTPAAANMMLSILRMLHGFAAKRHEGVKDWTLGVERFDDGEEHEPWPEHVLDAALASPDDLFRRAVKLHLYTGQRTGDVCAMTRGALSGGKIRVKQQKTKALLEIGLHPELAPEIESLPPPRKHLFILSNREGGQLTPTTFRKWCADFAEEMGVPKVVPHGLRKNAVNELFEAGCSAAEIAAVTGHTNLAMLEKYGKKRDQGRLSNVAMGRWARSGTGGERENR